MKLSRNPIEIEYPEREREREQLRLPRCSFHFSLPVPAPSSTSHFIIASTTWQTSQWMVGYSLFVVNPASSSKSNRKTFSSFLFKHYLKRCRAARSIVASFDSRRIPRQIETFLSEEEVIFPPNPFVLGKFRSTNCKETNFHDCYMRL